MATKMFLKSDYYDLEEVHQLNVHLRSFPLATMCEADALIVLNLYRKSQSFDNLADYVPGSAKYEAIVAENKEYEDAKKTLKELNHSVVTLVDEHYPDYLNMCRHSIKDRVVVHRGIWDEHEENWESHKPQYFYTINNEYCNDPSNACVSYINKREHSDDEDLIQNCLDRLYRANYENMALRYCLQHNFDFGLFSRVFNVYTIEYYILNDNIEYEGEQYAISDLKELFNEAKIAFDRAYIQKDKYVKYPNVLYMDFLKNPLPVANIEK